MTTVGYGGSPETNSGRILTMAVLAVGIGFVAVVTGALAQRFLATEVAEVSEIAHEAEEADLAVLAELRELRARLEGIESRLQRRMS